MLCLMLLLLLAVVTSLALRAGTIAGLDYTLMVEEAKLEGAERR
jgi:hypothetical protein